MFLSDLRYQIIPDEMQIIFIGVGIVHSYIVSSSLNPLNIITNMVMAAIIVMVPLLLIFVLTKGKGMGFGDVKFAFGMGILLGIWYGLAALYIAFTFGGIIGGLILFMKKGSLKSKIPFGPFLFIGTYLVLFFNYEIIAFISNIMNF